ncbi:MAG TPA: sugar phosphate isomerase/epimerase family protein [Anaerolineae bacterium]|nr:sugar phosphate isomerase/epimerase family protein [Anaerolineae bacterium]
MTLPFRLTRYPLAANLWAFGSHPLTTTIPLCQQIGLQGVVIPLPTQLNIIRPLLQQHNLTLFATQAPSHDLTNPATQPDNIAHYQRYIEQTADLGAPTLLCRWDSLPLTTTTDWPLARQHLTNALGQLLPHAQKHNVQLALGPVNRYESPLLTTAQQATHIIQTLNDPHLGLALNSFHMNIEEQNAPNIIRDAGPQLFLYFAADSNRGAIGQGHIDFGKQLWGLEASDYTGPIIFEPWPRDAGWPPTSPPSLTWLQQQLQEMYQWF